MRVLILGAGIVGSNLADQLSREGHDIYVIERDPEIVRSINDNLDVFSMTGSGTSQSTLESVGIKDMDLMVSVTSSDEINILSCLMGSKYGVRTLVARVKNPEIVSEGTIFNKENFGIDLFINSTSIVVEMIEHLIEVPGCTDVAYVGQGEIQFRQFVLPANSSKVGMSVSDFQAQLVQDALSIVAITQAGKTFIPNGDELLGAGDRILFCLATNSLNFLLNALNLRLDEARKIVLFGSSPAGIELARRLEGRYEQVIILEPDPQRCREMTKVLKKPLIIQGSALDKGTLEEIGIETVDVFACLSERDEDNFMAAMMAKQYGASRTVVSVEKPVYLEILEKSEIDIVINPRLITVGKILQLLRRGGPKSASKLVGEAEVLEYEIHDDSPIVGKRISKLKEKGLLPKGAVLACIREESLMIIPDEKTVVLSGQRVVIFSLPEALEKVQDLISAHKW